MSGLDIQIGDCLNPSCYHGTLATGKHKAEAMFWAYIGYDISVCYLPFLHRVLVVMSRKFMCRLTLGWGALSHENVLPLLGICEAVIGPQEIGINFVFVTPYMKHGTLRQWRKNANPSGAEVRDRVSLMLPLHN
jgi:hypothetical protein